MYKYLSSLYRNQSQETWRFFTSYLNQNKMLFSIKFKRYRVQRSAGVRFKVGQLFEIVRCR